MSKGQSARARSARPLLRPGTTVLVEEPGLCAIKIRAQRPAFLLILMDRSPSMDVDHSGRLRPAASRAAELLGLLSMKLDEAGRQRRGLGRGLRIGLLVYSSRGGTAMCGALRTAHGLATDWVRRHPRGHPPFVLHLTDGEATDGDPEVEFSQPGRLGKTSRQPVVAHALFLAPLRQRLAFPASEAALLDGLARKFFRMSSPIPPWLQSLSHALDIRPQVGARALLLDVDVEQLRSAAEASPARPQGGVSTADPPSQAVEGKP